MTKRFGFTLAEVLITLGIIGVVAAMTIPTLISNTNGAQFKTAYKKALSTLNQAVLMNIAMEDTDFSTLNKETVSGTAPNITVTLGAESTMSKLLTSRLQSATTIAYEDTTDLSVGVGSDGNTKTGVSLSYTVNCVSPSGGGDPTLVGGGALPEGNDGCTDGTSTITTTMPLAIGEYIAYSFADGTAFLYHRDAYECSDSNAIANKCYGFIDVNGVTGPNSVIKCTTGSEGGTGDDACEVDSSGVTDIYPVIFHGQTVEPATDAARAVLFGK